jgi:hypothetical protein
MLDLHGISQAAFDLIVQAEVARMVLTRLRAVVDIPWGAALDVFSNMSVPKYLRLCQTLPHFDELPPDCKGVLLSLVYNRGASFDADGARYAEMRAIKRDMAARRFAEIPGHLRSMKRLWTTPSVRGVALRREQEARLFEKGLVSLEAAA